MNNNDVHRQATLICIIKNCSKTFSELRNNSFWTTLPIYNDDTERGLGLYVLRKSLDLTVRSKRPALSLLVFSKLGNLILLVGLNLLAAVMFLLRAFKALHLLVSYLAVLFLRCLWTTHLMQAGWSVAMRFATISTPSQRRASKDPKTIFTDNDNTRQFWYECLVPFVGTTTHWRDLMPHLSIEALSTPNGVTLMMS